MTGDNYIRHFKVLGKLCKLYDTATADIPTQQALLAAFVDQYADGDIDSLPAIILFSSYQQQWLSSIAGGASALQSIAQNAAKAYLINVNFTADLTTAPDAVSPLGSLEALRTDMGVGVDNKTLTALDTVGLVNFFNKIEGATPTWHTAADASADYKDSVYVVATVV